MLEYVPAGKTKIKKFTKTFWDYLILISCFTLSSWIYRHILFLQQCLSYLWLVNELNVSYYLFSTYFANFRLWKCFSCFGQILPKLESFICFLQLTLAFSHIRKALVFFPFIFQLFYTIIFLSFSFFLANLKVFALPFCRLGLFPNLELKALAVEL